MRLPLLFRVYPAHRGCLRGPGGLSRRGYGYVLPPDTLTQYTERGYALLPGFAADSVEALKGRMAQMVADFEPGERLVTFDTVDQKQANEDYFLTSGDQLRFFLEDEAVRDGRLTRPKSDAINKCGHALHARDPVFNQFCTLPRVLKLMRLLGQREPTVVQTMYIFKPPHVGGVVLPHQDDTFVTTDPPSCVGLWVALDAAAAANGCMWVAPGSHRLGTTCRFALNESRTAARFVPEGAPMVPEIPDGDYVCIEAQPGDALVFHGALVHKSDRNGSDRPRHAFTMHVVDGAHPLAPDCWLQRGCARVVLASP